MDAISNADRLVMLLRQQLLERSKAASVRGTNRKADARRLGPAEPAGIEALAAVEGVDEHQLRRAFIQTLLADQLGPALVNDAKFQQIVSRVTETIEDDRESSALLVRLIADVRPS